MTFPPGPPAGGPVGPSGQPAPPPWDPRAASRPFAVPPGAPAPQYPFGAPTGPPPMSPPQSGPEPVHGPGQGPLPQHPGGQGWYAGPPGQPPAVLPAGRFVVPLRVAALVLVALGLSIPFDSSSDWAARTTWAIFAILATLVQLAASGGSAFNWDQRRSWLIGAVATGALTVHWLLIALPSVGSNAGFCLTFGTAAAIGAVLLAPGRRW